MGTGLQVFRGPRVDGFEGFDGFRGFRVSSFFFLGGGGGGVWGGRGF